MKHTTFLLTFDSLKLKLVKVYINPRAILLFASGLRSSKASLSQFSSCLALWLRGALRRTIDVNGRTLRLCVIGISLPFCHNCPHA